MTLNDIKKMNNIHNIPKWVHINKNILFDYRLCEALTNEVDYNVREYKYDFDVYLSKYDINLQRPYVWEGHQQREFILSILLEKPIDPVVLIQYETGENRNDATFFVIDGKQRLMTLQKFLRNEFYIIVNGEEVYFKDFDENLKRFFKRRANDMTGIVYYSYPDQEVDDDMKIILFNFYNFAGTPQTEAHKNKLQSLLRK